MKKPNLPTDVNETLLERIEQINDMLASMRALIGEADKEKDSDLIGSLENYMSDLNNEQEELTNMVTYEPVKGDAGRCEL